MYKCKIKHVRAKRKKAAKENPVEAIFSLFKLVKKRLLKKLVEENTFNWVI